MSRALVLVIALATPPASPTPPPAPVRVPVVEVTAELAGLPESERAALVPLVRAASVMEALFLRQVSALNPGFAVALASDQSEAGRVRLRRFRAESGPWLRRERDRVFLPGVGPKPLVGTFYPADASRQELETWLSRLDADAYAAATSPVTTIRRTPANTFEVVPYSREYQPELDHAGALLREASSISREPTLRAFLDARAGAFSSDDYKRSEIAWLKVDGALEATIGPYEIYEDGWFNAKADFQGVIAVRHAAATETLSRIRAQLQDLEDHLPQPPAQRHPDIAARSGADAPLRVVDVVAAGGDVHRALAAGTFVLPNDDRLTGPYGRKRTLMRNVHEARFRALRAPFVQKLLPAVRQDFEAYFTQLVVHELMHLLGPREITVDGRRTRVGERLQETHAAIEEAKADVTAVLAIDRLVARKVLPAALARPLPGTFVGTLLDRVRSGTGDPRGQAAAVILNALLEAGGVRLARAAFAVDDAKLTAALTTLATELLAIEAAGDRSRAARLLKEKGRLSPELRAVIDQALRSRNLPDDLDLRFVTGEKLLREVQPR
jgi:hypothetical protein